MLLPTGPTFAVVACAVTGATTSGTTLGALTIDGAAGRFTGAGESSVFFTPPSPSFGWISTGIVNMGIEN